MLPVTGARNLSSWSLRAWPAEPCARAMARSISAETHSGFAAFRWDWTFYAAERRHAELSAAGRDPLILEWLDDAGRELAGQRTRPGLVTSGTVT